MSHQRKAVSGRRSCLLHLYTLHINRFDILATTDDERSDGGQFVEQRSTRASTMRQLSHYY